MQFPTHPHFLSAQGSWETQTQRMTLSNVAKIISLDKTRFTLYINYFPALNT